MARPAWRRQRYDGVERNARHGTASPFFQRADDAAATWAYRHRDLQRLSRVKRDERICGRYLLRADEHQRKCTFESVATDTHECFGRERELHRHPQQFIGLPIAPPVLYPA